MKMIRLMCLASLIVSAPVLADGYGAAGCGLGSVVFGKQVGFVQVFAATTNGSSGNQTFGISSGTSNCVPGSKMAAFNQQKHFVDTNLASLAAEMAQGSGETLAAYTRTFGCSSLGEDAVKKSLQQGHGSIFKETSVDAIVFATHSVLKSSNAAVSACKDLI
jgi:hypothetical protein